MPEKLDQTQQHEHKHRIDIGGEENIHPENEVDFPIESDEKISISHTIFVCILIAAGGFIFGYDTGSIGGVTAMPMYIKAAGDFDPTTGGYILPTYRSSLIIGASTIGGLFGSLGGGQIAERWGRRWGMATTTILCVWLLCSTVFSETSGLSFSLLDSFPVLPLVVFLLFVLCTLVKLPLLSSVLFSFPSSSSSSLVVSSLVN